MGDRRQTPGHRTERAGRVELFLRGSTGRANRRERGLGAIDSSGHRLWTVLPVSPVVGPPDERVASARESSTQRAKRTMGSRKGALLGGGSQHGAGAGDRDDIQ